MEFISNIPYGNRLTSSLCVMELIQGCLNKDELRLVKKFIRENFPAVIHPDEKTSQKAIALLERHTLSDGLRTVDAMIAASALINSADLAMANYKHFKSISSLEIIKFTP